MGRAPDLDSPHEVARLAAELTPHVEVRIVELGATILLDE